MTSNFIKGTGRLALDRFDAQAHFNGTNFRHKASYIDIDNPSLVFDNATTVEQALEDLNTFVTSAINNGIGYAFLPDGYNTYHNANGTINFDTTIPSLDTFLNPVFASIVQIQAGTSPTHPLPAGFSRVQYGGVILIKAGTYIVANTINIPPGIILLGEGFGTKIINATSLNTSVLPPVPKGSPTPAPVFKILADPNRSTGFFADDLAVDPNLFVFQRETKIMNMVVSDNFVEPTELGDTFYKLPQNLTRSSTLNPPPLIDQQLGSNFSLQNVIATGRANFSSGQIVSEVTGNLLALDGYTFFETNTFCKIDNCFIDGFSIPLDWSNANVGDGYDYLEIKNSKIRGYGYYNGDSTDGYDNTIIKSAPQHISIIGNTVYGNASNVSSLLYLTGNLAAPNKQARSKVEVVGNQIIINKSSNTTNSTWKPVFIDASIGSPNNLMSLLIYGNAFQDTWDLYADAGSGFSSPGLGTPFISVDGYGDTATITTANGLTINGPTTINNAQTIDLNGTETVGSGGHITLASGSFLTAQNGSTVGIQSGAIFTVSSSPNVNIMLGANSAFDAQSNSIVTLDGYTTYKMNVVASNYGIDGYGSDTFVGVNTSIGQFSIQLPVSQSGRVITIYDNAGNGAINHTNITTSSSQHISGFSSLTISKAYGSVTMVGDSNNWFIVSAYNFP